MVPSMTMRLITVAFVLSAFMSIQALAQAQTSGRSVYVNTEAFYDQKAGITKLVIAATKVETEFAVKIKELRDGSTKLEGISKELANLSKLPPAQFNQAAFTAKRDEGETLERDLKYKKEDLERAIAKRREQVIGPVTREIGKGIDEFGAKNGYAVILDLAKMGESGALLFLAPSADVTKEFILFFNARPATVGAPK